MSDTAMYVEKWLRTATYAPALLTPLGGHSPGDVWALGADDMLSLADTLAAGRVFLRLREAWAKEGGKDLFQALCPGGGHAHLGHVVFGQDLPSLEAAADKVIGGGG